MVEDFQRQIYFVNDLHFAMETRKKYCLNITFVVLWNSFKSPLISSTYQSTNLVKTAIPTEHHCMVFAKYISFVYDAKYVNLHHYWMLLYIG